MNARHMRNMLIYFVNIISVSLMFVNKKIVKSHNWTAENKSYLSLINKNHL